MNNVELKHYGILGMKWGVRRTPEQIGNHRIPKGTKMYRATANKDESTNGSKYVTYLDVDRDYYRSYKGGNFIKRMSDTADLYEKQYELKEDLKVAGRNQIESVINQLYANKKKLVTDTVYKDLYAMNGGWELSQREKMKRDLIEEEGKELYDEINRELKNEGKAYVDYAKESGMLDQPYERFLYTTNALGGHPKLREEIINELKKRGFNSMTDYASVGNNKVGRIGVDPLIIFDGDSSLRDLGSEEVSSETSTKATKRYEKWEKVARNNRNKANWGWKNREW